ncbi:hypothetical protein HGB07_08150 [Candidatus Roizmanbacteria bacterium]|nr:hypothetical protein [Candidatus Roizmanbacteria bacterium]
MNWDLFSQKMTDLSVKVNVTPDIIVGITRGGLIPARLLSSLLKVKSMYCLSVEKQGEERKVMTEITADLAGKKIVLVEDMLETGRSLGVAKKYLEGKGATVYTACLFVMPQSEVAPDFSLDEVNEVIHFPWE